MKALIIDDSDYKSQEIADVLAEISYISEIKSARSFQGSLRILDSFAPDIVFMDMTLPTSEDADGALEGRDRLYGGRELIAEFEFLRIQTHVIIVSQFDQFGEGSSAITLETLTKRVKESFPNLIYGCVYYSNVDTQWRAALLSLIEGIRKRTQ